jgi:hypothetical protein
MSLLRNSRDVVPKRILKALEHFSGLIRCQGDGFRPKKIDLQTLWKGNLNLSLTIRELYHSLPYF